MRRESFVFHVANSELLGMLPPEQRLVIYDFLPKFAEADGDIEPPDMDIASAIVLKVITDRMRDDFRKWDETRAKRAEGGKMGGRPKKETENLKVSEEPKGYFENLSKAKKPVYVSVSGNVSDTVAVSAYEGATAPVSAYEGAAAHSQIEEYYIAYCKQQGYQIRTEFTDRFLSYPHGNDWQAEVRAWADKDEQRRKSRPQKTTQNFTPSDVDWNELAMQVMQAQQTERGEE